MKKLWLIPLLFFSRFLFANNFNDYKAHIAHDRLLIIFEQSVSSERKAEIIQASGLISHFTYIASPALTICFTDRFDEAQKYFATIPEIKFVSFFITDKKNYAGVLNQFFVKIKDSNFEPMLLEKLRQQNLGEAVPDKYIPNLYKVYNYKITTKNTIELCDEFIKEGWCEYASPDYLLNPLVCSNDPFYARQWNISNTGSSLQGNGTPDADMDVDSAWTISTGDSSIKVAIIDSGVDTLHADLKQNMLPGHDAVSDSTGGFPTPNFNEDGHGTCCAGIVAAIKGNGIGIAGVAPSCKIIPVRAFNYVELSPGSGAIPFSTAAAFADAIGWSWSVAKADILSNSWGLPPSFISILPGGTQPVEDAIQQAYVNGRNGKGIAMFFSSGNENDSIGPIWPGSLPQTISVNATSMCDERKNPDDCSTEDWGGDRGVGLDFSAPGVKISTTDIRGINGFANGDYYVSFNGTSAACPNAAAVGALILSVRPDLTGEDVRNIIAQTCDKAGGYAYDSNFANGSWSKELGYGRVNAYRALQYAQTFSSVGIEESENQMQVFPNPAKEKVQIEWTGNQRTIFRIFDTTGKELSSGQLLEELNQVNVSDFSSGIYLIKIENETFSMSRKLIILK